MKSLTSGTWLASPRNVRRSGRVARAADVSLAAPGQDDAEPRPFRESMMDCACPWLCTV